MQLLQNLFLLAYSLTLVRSFPPSHILATSAMTEANSSSIPGPCSGNSPKNRTNWCEYDIGHDYTSESPSTGIVREYWFNIQHSFAAPDGNTRRVLSVNGSIPGPTIIADWGDDVIVHVTNNLGDGSEGVSLHFHGIKQNYTNPADGVVSITQCPTAPGHTITYRWHAAQYGTSWYHSHIGFQAWEGVAGGIIINGPATTNYDEDKGVIFLSDWSHLTMNDLSVAAGSIHQPTMENGLINGTNINESRGGEFAAGARFTMAFTERTSYRIRFINNAMDSHFKVMIDHHMFTVIAIDLVPIVPYKTSILSIAIGQRYDVVVEADQRSKGNFWMRAIPQMVCSQNGNPDGIRGIIHYGDTPGIPETSPHAFTEGCEDEETHKLIPYVPKSVGRPVMNRTIQISLGRDEKKLYRWQLGNLTMKADWKTPTLLQVSDNESTYRKESAVVHLPWQNEWVYLIINNSADYYHPIHLHGHDFMILAQGNGSFDRSHLSLSPNPPRRDTAILPYAGHLVLAFQTDNPGAWLLHCHIGWHSAEGFALQFLERASELRTLIDQDSLASNCAGWTNYVNSGLNMDMRLDSGI